jgi:hypothetical protein
MPIDLIARSGTDHIGYGFVLSLFVSREDPTFVACCKSCWFEARRSMSVQITNLTSQLDMMSAGASHIAFGCTSRNMFNVDRSLVHRFVILDDGSNWLHPRYSRQLYVMTNPNPCARLARYINDRSCPPRL